MSILEILDKFITRLTQNRRLALAAVLVLTVLTYSNIFPNEFVMDDYDFIVDWPLIQNLNNLPHFFTAHSQPQGQEGIYSPLKTLFHAVSFHFWDDNVFGYHLVALLVHLLTVMLVYQISFLLVRHAFVAFFTALFFGLHPIHTESISFMTASIDMIGILFLFTAFWLYMRAVEERPGINKGLYAASLVYGLLAIFTYELALSLPFLFLFYEFCFNREKFKERPVLARLAPYFIMAGFYMLIRWMVLGSISRGGYIYDSPYLTFLVMVKAMAEYVIISFWPMALCTDHILSTGIFSFAPYDFVKEAVQFQSILDIQVLASLLLLGSIAFLAVKYFKKNRLISFCLGWFFISLLPVSNIVPSSIFFGERYLYPGSFGFCLLLAYGLFHLYYWAGPVHFKNFSRWLCIIFVLTVGIFYSMRTILRNRDWQNEIVFYQKEAQSNPQSALAETNLGVIYSRYGLYPEAIKAFEQARRLNPYDTHIYFSMAEAYTESGKHYDAIKVLEKAVMIDPDFAEAYYNIAVAKGILGLNDESRQYLNKALELYRKQGRAAEAEEVRAAYEDYFRAVNSPRIPEGRNGSFRRHSGL